MTKVYVTDLPTGGQHFLRVYPTGETEAAYRPDHHATWCPPLPVRTEEATS